MQKERVKVLVTLSCLKLFNPMDCRCQAPLSMGFSRQEYWSQEGWLLGVVRKRNSTAKKKRTLEWVAMPFSRRASWSRD